ncbi:glycoside hydrolase family 28 protein [Musicola paradisiaca]|uniref:Glycoside hydrolase family 28 n=1 Tax=Musicola paradisiaca (strain Ech703) TaxID=579405 RepID=C6CBJ3_MUSP7|nr:glycosyl hydrolase family 28 protein [Musicola paradisiaca]ACS84778.1 glycoside hydrolase family 28 [Musicola paradisiaca Ech703]
MRISLDEVTINRDGSVLVTALLQRMIDKIHDAGGGTLIVTPGIYRTGTLVLPSDFCLQLDAGATLLASADYGDYAAAQTLTTAELSNSALLYARGQQNITLCGAGKIDGNADAFFSSQADEQGYRLPHSHRPRMVVFEDCQAIRLQDITLTQSPMWTVHLVSCAQVFIARICVDNDLTMANTDALDIDSCQQVHISDCHFSAADDGICLKTTRKTPQIQRPLRNVTVTNCTLRSKSCAIKIGTETFADIENVTISNCSIYESNRGIGIISRDGGRFSRLIFSNITYSCAYAHACHWGKSDPIFISVRFRDPEIRPGNISDVAFNNIVGVTEGAINLHSEIQGAIENIAFNAVSIRQLPSDNHAQGEYDIRPPCNPERPTGMGLDNAYRVNPQTGRAFGVEKYPGGLPAIFAKGVASLHLNDIQIIRPDHLPPGWNPQAIVMEDAITAP